MSVELLERGLLMRNRLGIRAAVSWFEAQGISPELATVALVGSDKARKHGVHVGYIASGRWNKWPNIS